MPPPTTASTIARERKTTIHDIFEQATEQNMSLAELAANLGVTPETVRNYLKSYGYETAVLIRRKR